jgi:hypothetical protein
MAPQRAQSVKGRTQRNKLRKTISHRFERGIHCDIGIGLMKFSQNSLFDPEGITYL